MLYSSPILSLISKNLRETRYHRSTSFDLDLSLSEKFVYRNQSNQTVITQICFTRPICDRNYMNPSRASSAIQPSSSLSEITRICVISDGESNFDPYSRSKALARAVQSFVCSQGYLVRLVFSRLRFLQTGP